MSILSNPPRPDARPTTLVLAAIGGAGVGVLGGLVGLGGAEFRLPMLIVLFGFAALQAVIVNKAISLVVVTSALHFRSREVPLDALLAHGEIVLNLLAGSMLGAWWGASWAVRATPRTLHRWMAVLLVAIAVALLLHQALPTSGAPGLDGAMRWPLGIAAGFGIGAVAALLGVAGGELLIPTIVLLFGADIKLAGSLSLAVSLPTMLVSFARYSRDGSFQVLRAHRPLVLALAGGSIVGAWIGALLLGLAPERVLVPMLSLLLLVSAGKIWRHVP
jgi:uncharacterized membrane protein YfcA